MVVYMEIGKILKEAREEKNITLDNLQETTKIQKRYLVAIEEGNFHILPGTFYARAFIKEYATAVGLDPNELLETYQDELPSPEDRDTVQYTRMQRSRRRSGAAKSPAILSVLPTIIVVLLIVGILFVGWTLYQKANPDNEGNNDSVERQDDELIRNSNHLETNEQNEEEPEDGTNENTNAEEEVIEEDPEPEIELNLVEAGTGDKPESTYELINAGDNITLVFEPTGRTWLDVENEQRERLLAVNTEADTPIELDIEDEDIIRINVGFAPALPVIKINDIELEYPLDTDQFHTQRFWIHKQQSNE